MSGINITKIQALFRGYSCRKKLISLKDSMSLNSVSKYIDGYNTLLRLRNELNPILNDKKIRTINYPSEITENIAKFARNFVVIRFPLSDPQNNGNN